MVVIEFLRIDGESAVIHRVGENGGTGTFRPALLNRGLVGGSWFDVISRRQFLRHSNRLALVLVQQLFLQLATFLLLGYQFSFQLQYSLLQVDNLLPIEGPFRLNGLVQRFQIGTRLRRHTFATFRPRRGTVAASGLATLEHWNGSAFCTATAGAD